MITVKERITKTIANLDETQLNEVAQYLDFLKFREERIIETDTDEYAELYAEFAEEDRLLAEIEISSYNANLQNEDSAR